MSSSRRHAFESPRHSTQHHHRSIEDGFAANFPPMTSWMKRKLHASTDMVRKEADFWAGDEILVVPSDAVESLFDVTLEGLDFEGADDPSPVKGFRNGMGSELSFSPLRIPRPSSGPVLEDGLSLNAGVGQMMHTQLQNLGPVSSKNGSNAFYDIIAHAQRPSTPSIQPNAFSPLRMDPFSASRNEIEPVNSFTWTRTTTRPGPKAENAYPSVALLPTRLISQYASMANPRPALFIPTLSSKTFSVYPRTSEPSYDISGRQAHSASREKEIPKIVVNGPGPGEEVDMDDRVDAGSDSMIEEREVLEMLFETTDDSDTDVACGDTNSLGRESFCVPEDSSTPSSSRETASAPTFLKFESPKTETKIKTTGPLRTHRLDIGPPSTPPSKRPKKSEKKHTKKVRPSSGAENVHIKHHAVDRGSKFAGTELVSPERFMGSIPTAAASGSAFGRDEYAYDLRQPRSTPRRDRRIL